MSVICFVSYEIHPTVRGGCGVLLHHAATRLLRAGHEVVFLLDLPDDCFERFNTHDRLALPNAERCRAYHVGALAPRAGVGAAPLWLARSIRFADALGEVERREKLDAIEFFDFTGPAYAALARRLFRGAGGAPIAVRLHNTLELIDDFAPTRAFDRDRSTLHALERASLRLADAVLTPTRTYFDAHCGRYRVEPARVRVSLPARGETAPAPRPDPRGPFSIAHVGRLMQFKGVDQLVIAASELFRRRPQLNATVELIGGDTDESPTARSYAEHLRSLIPAGLRARFVFAGHLTHEQIRERLGRALFAVYPNRFESFCFALHETRDAGVPVIVRDIPGLREFAVHERNALVYDGRTDALVAAMERMVGDAGLRERLAAATPAAPPLGDFYANPPRPAARLALPRALAIVLDDSDATALQRTRDALAAQSFPAAQVVELSGGEGGEPLEFLGRVRRIARGGARTLDAVVMFRAGDVPAPDWLKLCASALTDPRVAFASTWATHKGRTLATVADLEPELLPFTRGAARTHCLIRTEPGLMLADLLDAGLAELGEIGLLWSTLARGMGLAFPEPHIEVVDADPIATDPRLIKYLITRYGAPVADRLSLFAAFQHEQHPRVAHDDLRVRLAEELGARALATMALRKIARRITP